MTRNELIAKVALDYIRQQLEMETEGSLRFCMVGLDREIVVQTALTLIDDGHIGPVIAVRVPSLFASDSTLPAEAISDESITHWRHCRLGQDKRGVLFAASHEELQRNEKSVEKITRIETDRLRELYSFWAERAGLNAQHLNKKKLEHLNAALQAANETHAARTIEMFADFVMAISQGVVSAGLPLQKALDNALPALRLPRNAGNFDALNEKSRGEKEEWAKVFRRLHTHVRPFLVREDEKGEPITELIRANAAKEMERLTGEQITVIRAFLEADVSPDSWLPAQSALAELDWPSISDLFHDTERLKAQPFGQRTIQFFQDEFDDQLEDDERDLLMGALPKVPTEQLEGFFDTRREQLARDKKLYGQWEKYIYRNPQPFDDFLVGLLDTLQRLRDRTEDAELKTRKLIVRIPHGREKSFWRGKNVNVARYFAFRYRGLDRLFDAPIELDFGKLWEFYFPEPHQDLKSSTSGSREARQLKFEVELDPEGAKAKLMFIWEMPVDALAGAMADDLLQIAHPKWNRALLPTADIARQSVSAKGQIQRISLLDVNTVRDVHNENGGALVAPNKASGDRGEAFLSGLKELRGSIIDDYQHSQLAAAFHDFTECYTAAVRDWVDDQGTGISSGAFLKQAEAYGALFVTLLEHANKDVARDKIWRELLRIGVANVGGGAAAAILTPWHPLRMVEFHIKAVQAARLVKQVLNANESDIFRADILFNQKKQELKSDYYPDICVGFEDEGPVLLAAAETAFGYTLSELPRRKPAVNGEGTLDVDPTVAARAFGAVAEQYLNLLPHERTNFSVVLYNAESKVLPSAIASELSSKVEQESELQCDLLLTHSQPKQMRRIYEQQNVAVSEDSGSIMASEAARNFLSRLRVGFLDASTIPTDNDSRASDLVLLQDVIARNAEIQWKRAPGERHPELLDHIPGRWSRRKPIGPGDHSAAVYLTAPVQPRAVQSYLNAVHMFLKGNNAPQGNYVPAREISFGDRELGDVFKDTHRIGEWVVNFDELVDRRLLSNNGVSVIRHIHDRTVDRNIVVSTTAKPRLLQTLLRERLNRIDPSIIPTYGEEVVDRLIARANALSGQVVMRAARYGHFANELLGVVLSMQQLQAGLGDEREPIGWYFLDDFASWFGQREEQIADVMAIAPRVENGERVLKVAFSEAKFVNSHIYSAQAKKSARQLEETVARVARALDPKHKRIDREAWLHRIGDFMLEGMEPFDGLPGKRWDLHRWSDEVRQDNIRIELVGFSHVFVHDDNAYVDASGPVPLHGMEHCTQEIFDKPRVAAALRQFAANAQSSTAATTKETEGWPLALVSRNEGEQSRSADTKANVNSSAPMAAGGKHDKPGPSVQDRPTVGTTKHERNQASPERTVSEEPAMPTDGPAVVRAMDGDGLQWPSAELALWVRQGKAFGEEDEQAMVWLDETVTRLRRALRGYDMTAELLGSRLTPNAALVRFRGSDDLTIPKVEKRRQELLTSHAIDVINVLAAPMEIIIMVRRPARAVLRLQDLWRQRELPETAPDMNTSLLLGARETDGDMLYLNVGDGFAGYQPHGPHTLIAGETGSGKGVLLQCILLDICATNSPEAAQIWMIDPKAGIDFPWLRKMPHLNGDLITTQPDAITVFEELVGEMERRNRLLADAGTNKLPQYNKKVSANERLPRIWLFHDELADWMLIDEYRDAVETNVTRLGVKARAAGINLVLVTQRPDKDALPMQLRANLSNRLVLKVADKRNSELVLDEPGAERLLGRGHLAAKLSGEGKTILAQVPFVSEDEITELAELIARSYMQRRAT